MNAGYGATALNTGALNTGASLVRGRNIGDALTDGATAALLSPVSSYTSGAVGGGLAGSVAGNAALGAARAGLTGRDVMSGARDGGVNGLVSYAGSQMGDWAKGATDSNFAGQAANSLTQGALRGKAPSIDDLAAMYAKGELVDLTGMPKEMASIVVNLAQHKKISPVGALSAISSVGSPKLKRTAVGA